MTEFMGFAFVCYINREIKHDVYFSCKRHKFFFCYLSFSVGTRKWVGFCLCLSNVSFYPYFSEGFILEFDKKKGNKMNGKLAFDVFPYKVTLNLSIDFKRS